MANPDNAYKNWKDRRRRAFKKLQSERPDLIEPGARFIDSGSFGLVVGHSDDTVSKILYRPPNDPEALETILRYFYRETNALTIFARHPIEDVEIPTLIGDPQELYHSAYAATYRMTRLQGTSAQYTPSAHASPKTLSDYRALYDSVGALLGKFHRAAKDLPFPESFFSEKYSGGKISPSHLLSDKTNKALEKIDLYLQEHKESGVAHGDVHVGNFLARNNKATGILDFSFTHRSGNILSDFKNIPEEYMPDFIRGYERTTETIIDPYLLTATNISVQVDILNDCAKHPGRYLYHILKINEDLNKMTYLTGFKP